VVGFSSDDEVNAVVRLHKVEASPDGLGQRVSVIVTVRSNDRPFEFVLPMLGMHHVKNAMAAIAAALVLGVPIEDACQTLSRFVPAKGRMQLHRMADYVLIDDTYNANPDSVRAAIEVLATQAGERCLILGDMGEVGQQGRAFHEEVGRFAAEKKVSLWTVGDLCKYAAQGHGTAVYFESMDELVAAAVKEKWTGTLLIKGSRFMKMERVVAALLRLVQIFPK
jgi:UDP-N-acetylmuramyl pentapeptide synthase